MLGMSQTGYSKYETGENDLPTEVLIKLAKFYNTSIDYLLGQTEKKNDTNNRNVIKALQIKYFALLRCLFFR
ncbi:MAG TPA: hypothetical protein DCR23_03165 [Ruminococcaceae bacterium]|nr:hypothetical protein [Oscillospiraceae bacterium]